MTQPHLSSFSSCPFWPIIPLCTKGFSVTTHNRGSWGIYKTNTTWLLKMLKDTEAREMIRERRVQTARTHWSQPILSTNMHTQIRNKQMTNIWHSSLSRFQFSKFSKMPDFFLKGTTVPCTSISRLISFRTWTNLFSSSGLSQHKSACSN